MQKCQFLKIKSNTEYIKKLPCGCIEDTINGATEKLCQKHQIEFNAWKQKQKADVC